MSKHKFLAVALALVVLLVTVAATRTTQSTYTVYNGVDSRMLVTDGAAIQNVFDAGGTWAGWIYVESDGGNSVGRIVDKTRYILFVTESGGGYAVAFVYDFDSTDGQWSISGLSLNTWYYLEVTYDNGAVGNDPIFYIDGVAQSVTENVTPIGTRVSDVGTNLAIGNSPGTLVNGFDGFIDDVAIFDDIRSAGEAATDFTTALFVGNEANLAGYWPMTEGSGTFVSDWTGNLNFGTLASTTWGVDNDVTDAEVSARISVSNTSGQTFNASPGMVTWVELSSETLVDFDMTAADLLDADIQDNTGASVPFAPGMLKSVVKGCHLDDGGVLTDDTTDCTDSGVTDVPLTAATPAVDDAFVFQGYNPYTALWINISNAASNSSSTAMQIAWEYCHTSCPAGSDPSAWLPLLDVNDGTNHFRNTGLNKVSWTLPRAQTWVDRDFNSVVGVNVRARVTEAGGGTYATPIATQVWHERTVWPIFVETLGSDISTEYTLSLGQSKKKEFFHWFPGSGELSVADNAAIEPGSDFTVEFRGYIDMADGSTWQLFEKGSGDLDIDMTVPGTIGIDVGTAAYTVTASGTPWTNGLHTITLDNDAVDGLRLWVDGVLEDSRAGDTVPDNANTFDMLEGERLSGSGGINYVEYIKYWVGGDLKFAFQNQGSFDNLTFANLVNPGTHDIDLSGNDNLVPGLNGLVFDGSQLSAQLSSTLSPFRPINQPEALEVAPNAAIVSQTTGANVGFASLPSTTSTLPGFTVFNSVATDANIPVSFFYVLVGAILSIFGVALGYKLSNNAGVAGLAGGIVLTIFTAPSIGLFSLWGLLFYAAVGVAGMILMRRLPTG